TNSVIYGPSSTLNYIPFTSYNVSTEWTGNGTTAGLGIPANVTLGNGVTLNMPNTNRGIAGGIQIVNGTLVLNPSSGDLYIGGSWIRQATGNFTPNNRAVIFNGSGFQTITFTGGTESFPYLFIQKPSGTLGLTSTDIEVSANVGTIFGITNTGTGTFDLGTRSLTFNSTSGNINTNGGVANIIGNSGSLISISGGTKTITSTAGGTFNFGPNVTIALSSGLNFGNSLSTVNGTLQIANGGFVSTNPPIYSNTSTLRYFSGTSYNRGLEWSATSGPGYPNNVTIDFNGTPTTLDLGFGGSVVRQIGGNLTINDGGSLTMNTTPMNDYLRVLGNVTIGNGTSGSLILSNLNGGDLQVGGNLTRNAGATFTQNGREIIMNGTTALATQNINGVTTFDYLKIDNTGTGSSVKLNAATFVNNRLWLNNGFLNLDVYAITLSNLSQIRRSNSTSTISNNPTINGGNTVDMRYDATMITGNEFVNDLAKIRDLEITAGTLTLGGNKTINRNLILSGGDLNLGGFNMIARGRVASGNSGSIIVHNVPRNITGTGNFNITGLGETGNPGAFTKSVSSVSGGSLVFGSNVIVNLGDGGMDFGYSGTNLTTVNGILQILEGGSVGQILNSCNYGTNSTLRFANNVDYIVGPNDKTWAAGAINSGNAGIPFNVEILDAGTDLRLEDTRSLRGNLTITNGSFSLNYVGVGTFSLGGNWSRTGATSLFNDPTSKKIIFDRQAAGDQTITTGSGVAFETFYDLEISPDLGNVIATSGTAINVTNNLNFVTGKFILNGTNLITVGSASASGSITGVTPSKYLVTYSGGNTSILKRFTGLNAGYNFPVGDATNYTPIDLTLYNGSTPGSFITGSVKATSHPQIGTSLNYLNRYWSMEQTGLLAGFAYGVDFSYVQTDVAGSEATLFPYKWTPGSGTGTGWIGAGGSSAASQMGSGSVDIALNTMHWEGIYSFSDITGNGGGTPLPISLINFDAKKNGNTTALSWSTLSETNNDFFTVERTTDGVNYIELDKVDGAGNHNGILNYSTEDTNPVNGKNYYRLKQTDFDGNFEYSKLVLVEFEGIKSQKSISLYPNPSNGNNVNVSISGVHNKSLIILRLSNSTGAEVYNSNLTAASDFANVQLQTSDLANGIYYLQIIIDGEIINQKVVVNNR
ncbi:MAG: T9SS type A sorting domain-containing protein, partial [Bacteroidia bacterium]